MEIDQERIAGQVASFTDANRRSLGVLAEAIQRATGDDEATCFTRAWLLFRWARTQKEPRVAAAAGVRRMSEERRSPKGDSNFPIPTWWSFPPPSMKV